MKKSLIIGLLGSTMAVLSANAQGFIQFNSYTANNSLGIITTFGSGVSGQTSGTGLTPGWTAGLLYSVAPINESATTDPASASAPLNASWTFAPNTAIYQTSASLTPSGLGYYVGSNFTLPSYVSGLVYFEVIAYQTGLTYNTSTVRGHSASFSTALATGNNNVGTMDTMQPFSVFSVAPVPEPATLALAGLGGLASLVMLRRKKA